MQRVQNIYTYSYTHYPRGVLADSHFVYRQELQMALHLNYFCIFLFRIPQIGDCLHLCACNLLLASKQIEFNFNNFILFLECPRASCSRQT